MRLVDFFRHSVKVNMPMVALDDEMELLEAYMDLMCYRYPELKCEYDIDPELGGVMVPNFILQPIVENSLLHGLKNKGYRGEVNIIARKSAEHDDKMEILKVLNMKVKIDTITLTVLNSISYYVRSVFEAIENEDASFIRFYRYEF